jgi:hypothetical protein
VAHEGSWLRMSQISRFSDQSGPMSESLVARSTSTDCGIAAAETLSRRAPPAFPSAPSPSLAFGRRLFPVGERKGGEYQDKIQRSFWGCENRYGFLGGPTSHMKLAGLEHACCAVWDPRTRVPPADIG